MLIGLFIVLEAEITSTLHNWKFFLKYLVSLENSHQKKMWLKKINDTELEIEHDRDVWR